MLGDLVGYGADPNAVIDRVRGLAPLATIRGNHDKVAAGVEDAEGFNTIARSAVELDVLDAVAGERRLSGRAAAGPAVIDEWIEICHGTPYDEDAYVFDELDALRALESATRPVCFFGHTHIPVVFTRSAHGLEVEAPDGEPVWTLRARGRSALPHQPGLGRPAPRRRPARGVRDCRHGCTAGGAAPCALSVQTAQQKVCARGCPTSWRGAWESDGRRRDMHNAQ